MEEIIKKHTVSVKNAWAGIVWAFKTQPNFTIHFILSLLAIGMGLYVELTNVEWVLIVFTIFWGLGAEMINTALESMTDLITQEWHEKAKTAKDVAAGMMLMTAFGAIGVALLLLLPKLLFKLGL